MSPISKSIAAILLVHILFSSDLIRASDQSSGSELDTISEKAADNGNLAAAAIIGVDYENQDNARLANAMRGGDDDHANVDLTGISWAPANSKSKLDPVGMWLSRLIVGDNDGRQHRVSDQRQYIFANSKRAAFQPSRLGRDDRDYGAIQVLPRAATSFNHINANNNRRDLELASRASLLANELLREIMLTKNRVRYSDYLHEPSYARNGAEFEFVPQAKTGREKRRRCKVDPHLGVKNPSLCETEQYFGAADYSIRDVWDSAGK